MAEGLLREWAGDRFEAFSAGTEATGLRPEAVEVMAEIGIDISRQRSKTLSEFVAQSFDWYITVCDDSQESCPVLPGVPNTAHWSIADPSRADGTPELRREGFRRARDQIADRLRAFVSAPT